MRNRLLAPFRDELAPRAQISEDALQDYFEDVQAQKTGSPGTLPLANAIPKVHGQIVLEGESGLGKSMFLRRLVSGTTFPTAYLPADNCDHGVLEAIQLRLKGNASDETFLKSIVWSGGLHIVIDGLNEVTVETRVKIRRFLDDFPKAHILVATQALEWKRPPRAVSFQLIKLSDDRILQFLKSRYSTFATPAPMSEADYKKRCKAYVKEALHEKLSEEERSGARLVLSNPMDLTTVARILVSGTRPTLNNLQQQQFQAMKSDFDSKHPGEDFPLEHFSESVYQKRLLDDLSLDSENFFEAILSMVKYKMALEQYGLDAKNQPTRRWVFRHDKVRDYFLLQAFLQQPDERVPKHIDDPRFRGVYLMLASHLPLDQATALKDSLVERASKTKNHHLSDAVVQVLMTRKKPAKSSTTPSSSQ